jgi:riboflavin synthase
MFTGLISERGRVATLERSDEGARLRVRAALSAELADGDSVAVNGVCLTARDSSRDGFSADVMGETLRRSSLGPLIAGDEVNLELPLRAGDRLGGHVVQGHVDGVGTVESAEDDGFARLVRVAAPGELLRYVVEKGSVCLDGVSLTVADVDGGGFSVALIPETLERTTLGALSSGDSVNIEADVLAKHLEKLVESGAAEPQPERA